MRAIWMMGLVLVAVACGSDDPAGPSGGEDVTTTVEVGRSFQVAPGDLVRIDGAGLDIRFVGVADDSRCPVDVTCVWAGNAVVELELSLEGAPPRTVELNSTEGPRSHDAAGLRIRLEALGPAPVSTGSIAPGEYRATLSVVAR